MRGILSDRDIMQLILDQHKYQAKFLTDFVTECSNPALRHECQNALNSTLQHQRSVWETMYQRGWYQTVPANPQDVAMAQRSLATQYAQTSGIMGQGMGQGMGQTTGMGGLPSF